METPKVDLCFTVTGQSVPVDHGFALYSALSRVLPQIHEDEDIGVRLIRGRFVGAGMLDIAPAAELVLRLPSDRIQPHLALAGKRLAIGDQTVTVGVMHTRALIPALALYAHTGPAS